MKRFAIAAVATLMAVSPVAAAGASAQQRNDRAPAYDQRDNNRNAQRDDRRDNRQGLRNSRWDQRQHNGYYVNGRWNYGQPSAREQSRNDYRPGYLQWRRGDRIPTSYRSHYRNVDWQRERLRAPPRGYQYVRTDRGETLLVGIATGVILGLILANN